MSTWKAEPGFTIRRTGETMYLAEDHMKTEDKACSNLLFFLKNKFVCHACSNLHIILHKKTFAASTNQAFIMPTCKSYSLPTGVKRGRGVLRLRFTMYAPLEVQMFQSIELIHTTKLRGNRADLRGNG